MKKTFSMLIMIMCILVGGILFSACNDGDSTPSNPNNLPALNPPTLEKSSFSIKYEAKPDGKTDYKLTWSAEYALKYTVSLDGTGSTVTDNEISLNECTEGEIHTVAVTAIGMQDKTSDTVQVKFKAARLDAPINVRLYADGESNSLGWKASDDTTAYTLLCEELDLELETSRPIGTGNVKTYLVHNNRLSIYELRSLYRGLVLYSLEKFTVKALPYNGESKEFKYVNDTDIIEFILPSDASEQSVNLYAGEMSNPTNIRWDFSDFDEHPFCATVKWDGAIPNYSYNVMLHYPSHSSSIGVITEKGVSQGNLYLYYDMTAGDYTVTVESVCDDFHYIGEDTAEKYSTWTFFLDTPATEELKFHIDQTVLECPKNVRVDGENLVWDEVENAMEYDVLLQCGDKELSVSDATNRVSLKALYDTAINRINYDGDYSVSVMAISKNNEFEGYGNDNVPKIKIYVDSDYCTPVPNLIRFKAIPTAQNVQIDYQNKIITWDAVNGATSYYVVFFDNNGSVWTDLDGNVTQYIWDVQDISDCNYIVVMAKCDYSLTNENGITTISTSSSYIIEL